MVSIYVTGNGFQRQSDRIVWKIRMSIESKIPYRPLGLIASFLESAGFDVSYVYEDLVFPNHNAFLLRMERKGEEISVFFNEESDLNSRNTILKQLKEVSPQIGLKLSGKGCYRMISDEKTRTIDIEFTG